MFGKSHGRAWAAWYEYSMLFRSRIGHPLSIAFAFVATHNHFVLDRGGKVFKQSAPVIKLAAGASVDDHLALVGSLNSSVACFWMKQVFQRKTQMGGGGGSATVPFTHQYEHDGTKLQQFPLASSSPLELARRLDTLAQDLAAQPAGRRVRDLHAHPRRAGRPPDRVRADLRRDGGGCRRSWTGSACTPTG